MDYPSAAKVAGESCTVKPGSVYDGDTLRVLCNGEELKIRMCGIDAPETNQAGGIESRDYLRSLLPGNAPISVVRVETDQYGRTVAEIWNDQLTDTDQNVNAAMVLAKQAWHYEQYSGNCPNGNAITLRVKIGVFQFGRVLRSQRRDRLWQVLSPDGLDGCRDFGES